MAGNLLTASGTINSDVVEQHARAFTLDYLRHTILGAPREISSEPIQGPLLVIPDRSDLILNPGNEKLILTPNEEEKVQYVPKKVPAPTPQVRLDEGFLLKRFQKHFGKATVAGYINSELELLRTAISIQMERVLDAVHANDANLFNPVYSEVENTLTAEFKTLLPKFKEAGVPAPEAEKALKELAETSISAAIDKRVGTMEGEGARKAFCSHYEDLLNAYKEQQKTFQDAVDERRKNFTPTNRIQRYFIPHHPALTKHQVILRGKNLLTQHGEGYLPMHVNDKDGPAR